MLPQEIVFVGPDWFALKYTDKGHQREREIGRGFSIQVKKEFPRLFCPSKQEVVCMCVCFCVRVCVLVWSAWSARRKGLSGHIAECYFSFLLEIQIVLHCILDYCCE